MTTDSPDVATLRSAISVVPTWLRATIGVTGSFFLMVGTAAVFLTENGSGSAALIAAGVVLIILAVLTERLESLEAAGMKLQLTRALAEADADGADRAAAAAEIAGDDEEALRLRTQADTLRRKARITASAYDALRNRRPSSWERTGAIHKLLQDATADLSHVDRATAAEIFGSGTDGARVVALALMEKDPSSADIISIIDAILDSRSAMEQWHALRAAERFVESRDGEGPDVSAIGEAIQVGLSAGLIDPSNADRFETAQRILSRVSS